MTQIVGKPKGTKGTLSFYGGCEEFLRCRDHLVFLYGGTGSGKSLSSDSPVISDSGFTPIGKTKIGDKVFSKDGSLTNVVGVFPQGKLDVYKIVFSDGTSAEASLDHLWEVETRYIRRKRQGSKWERNKRPNQPNWKCNKPIIVTTEIIMNSIDKKYSIPLTSPVEFPKQNLEVHPYVLGLLLGDGGISGDSVLFSTADDELLEYIRQYSPSNTLIKHKTKYDYILTANDRNNILLKSLKILGLMGTHSHNKFIPNHYLFSSINDRILILQGLLDSDGHVSNNSIEYSTSSVQLKDGIKHIVQSLGGTCKITERYPKYTYKGEKRIGKLSYRVIIKLPNNIPAFKLKRKANLLTSRKYTPYRYIKSVEYIGKKECVCIKVEHPSETFLINDFIVTHNTTAACLKLFLLHILYPGSKSLMTRNSYVALVKSGVETFERVVRELGWEIGKKGNDPRTLYKLGESKPTEYVFPYAKRVDTDGTVYEGRSRILISSLSNVKDELGAEYDYIYLNQPELSTEDDWMFLTTRANGRRAGAPYPQIFGDPNPDHEQHWIWKGGQGTAREVYTYEKDNIATFKDDGPEIKLGLGDRWTLIRSLFFDNPTIWDHKLNCYTKEGEQMIAKLQKSLNPVMARRLIMGEWCSFEGLVFGDALDRSKHLRSSSEFNITDKWDRYWGIDFGFTDPFCFMMFAKNPEKEQYVCYKYIFMTNRTINEHVETIRDITIGEPRPKAIVADRNPESISVLSQELGMNVISAKKGAGSVKAGINILIDMLRNDELIFLDDALVEEDTVLREKKKPIGFIEEGENYRWDLDKKDEVPIGGDEHSIDTARYLFTYLKANQIVVPFIWK